MEDDVSEKPVSGMSYYQVLTGLPPAAPRPRQEDKKVIQESQKPSDDLPPSGFTPKNIQRNRNTLPKARQKAGAPPEEVYTSDNLSRTVSGENINSQTYYNRGRGVGNNYQNARGSQKPYRGSSRDNSNNYSNSLPRSRGGGSRGRGQYDSYGSLPRSQRGGRQEYGGGGDGPYRGNYENRGRGRGRGRGYFQGQTGSQGQIASQEHVSRAPSQRRIDSLQRKKKISAEKTKSFHEYEVPRASSVPRNPVKRSLPNLMSQSFSSSQNIWSPDGKCPSFADILKKATVSEEALEQSEKVEVPVNKISTTNLEVENISPGISNMETEETCQEASYGEKMTINQQIYTSTRIPEGFGSVPCLTQEKQNDAENLFKPLNKTENNSQMFSQISTMVSSNSLSLFSDNDTVVVSEVAVLEPSISQTVQIEKRENEVIKIEQTKEIVKDNLKSSSDELTNIDKASKPSSDDNISITSQKASRFGAIKSYANILSGGLRKVGSVFRSKTKEEPINKTEKENVDSKTESSDSSKAYKENIEPKTIVVNQSSKTSSTEKPEIPGLLFKTDLERRPSRKKRRSRPLSTFELEGKIESVENIAVEQNVSKNIETFKVEQSHQLDESNIEITVETVVEKKSVVLQEDFEEIRLTVNEKTNSNENSMRRRNSKKKKKESTPSKKFNDEIDQALHEIKLMDTEEQNKMKENTNSLKRRVSKKSKKSCDNADEKIKEELWTQSKDSDTGNIADDEGIKKKKTSIKFDKTKIKSSIVAKENETVPVKITSSFTGTKLEVMPDITHDATKSRAKLQLAEEGKHNSYSLNQDSSSYSFSIPDEEEIECLREDTVKKDNTTDNFLKKPSSIVENRMEMSSEIKVEAENIKETKENLKDTVLIKDTKPAIAGLPMDDASDAWMNDDVGTIDSEEEEDVDKIIIEKEKQVEKTEETTIVIEERIQEPPKDTKPAIAGLPMDDASDAWMNDDVGTINSDSEEEVEETKETIVSEKVNETTVIIEEKIQATKETIVSEKAKEKTVIQKEKIQATPKDTKPAIAGLPMDNASDAWMNDDVGTIDSNSEEEIDETKDTIVLEKAKETTLIIEEKIQATPKDTKIAIAGLPMDDASDAWMNDDVGTIDSDSEEEIEEIKETIVSKKTKETTEIIEEKIQATPKDTKPAIAGLPMDDASDACMNDDVGTIDSDSEEEVEETIISEKAKETTAILEEKIQATPKDTKPAIAGLPMDDASDAWMNDDVGTMDSDSEEEVDGTKETIVLEKAKETTAILEEKIQATPKDTKPAIAGLPMDDASDAWMNDDVGTINSDSEEEVEETEITVVSEKAKETTIIIEEKIQATPPDTKPAIAGLPMDDASDAWMNDDVGTIDSDSEEEVDETKETIVLEKSKETTLIIEEKIQVTPKDIQRAIAGLPMDDASDAWMNDDVGTIDSDSEEEVEETKNTVVSEKAKETTVIIEDKIQATPTDRKPAIAGLPMEDASDAWMNDDFGTIDSDDEDSIQSLDKEKKLLVEKIEEFKEKLTVKSVQSGFAGLPVDDVSYTWMNDDFVTIEDDEEDPSVAKQSSQVTGYACYSPLCSATPGNNCYSTTCNNFTSSKGSPEYDENDKETQMYAVNPNTEAEKVKEGRLSAIDEAKRFSCDDDEENQFTEAAEVVKDVIICDDDESTSWAFVASKEPAKVDEKISNVSRNMSTSSNPALIVEIIEQEPKLESMDPDGYKVVKGKTKTRDKRKSKEVPETSIEAIINQLDQPIDTKRVSLQTEEMSSAWMDDFEIVENKDAKETINKRDQVQLEETEKVMETVNPGRDANANYGDSDDPWLAVKKEYKRKDSSTNNETKDAEDADYTIEVKVTTKETCLGRRLHEQKEETEWKMDVQCTQKNTIPDIIEGYDGQNVSTLKVSKATSKSNVSDKKFNSLPRLKTKADSPERLCLSPAWMRKDLSRTQSVESNLGSEGGIFGSVKERKFSDSRTSCFTSSAETLDGNEDDVYWRLKHKVKKKKRRNQSGPSDAKSRENNDLLFSSTNDILESLNATVEPIIETKEESRQSFISTSSINTIQEIEPETTKNIDASTTKTSTAHPSMEQPNRKISSSQKIIPNEKLVSMEMDLLRKESVSPMQIDKESSISVPLESVAESDMKSDFSENIKVVKTSVANDEMHLANIPQIEIKRDESKSMATPSIVLQNEAESKMEGATEIIRASSPMLNQNRPEFKRQNSKEMQQAVEVQRPLSFERQKTLSVSLATDNLSDAWMDDNLGSIDDDELDKELDDKKKRTSWSSIAAKVVSKVAKTKSENVTRKISKHETLIVQAGNEIKVEMVKNVDEEGFEQCVGKKEMRQKRKSQNLDESENQKEEIIHPPCKDTKPAIAGLPMDDASDAWMNDDVGTIDSDSEDEVEKTKVSVIQKEEIIQPPSKDIKPAIAGLPMDDASDAWMNDDVGTIDSDSEDEIQEIKESTVQKEEIIQQPFKDAKPAIAGLPMDDASYAWMNDDVGTIDSDSEDEVEKNKEKEKIVLETKTQQNVDQRKSYAGLPTDNVTDAWMNDDLGSLDSEEEEEARPLALIAPSWAGIASKGSATGSIDPELPQLPKVISLKPSKTETLILEAEGEKTQVDEEEVDPEGFEVAVSRKIKRERRISKRISVSMDEESKEADEIDTDSVKYDMKVIEDAEIKYFESLEQNKSKASATSQENICPESVNKQQKGYESKPLGLPAPSWAGIASKPVLSCSEDPDLPMPPQLVALKPSKSQTLIIEADGEALTDEIEIDEEGFEVAISRKVKRERKISKRISLSIDEEHDKIETADEQTDVKMENVGLPKTGNSLIMNLSMDSFWVCKHIFDDAEEKYFANKKVNIIPIKEITKDNKKDDEDKDDDDDKDINKEMENNKRTKNSDSNIVNEEVETTEYNWTDESTYLSPNIPILKPMSLKISSPKDSMQIESHLSKNARNLSITIKKHMDNQIKTDQSETGEHIIGLSCQHNDDLKSSLKVDMDNLQKAVANIDDTLQQLTIEEIDGQLAVVKYTLKTLEELESEAISIEARLQKVPSGNDVDMMSLAATLTGTRTKLVTLHTQAEAQRARIERYMIERRKRITEIKRYQTLLIDLEQWLGEAQATISTEIRLTSVKVVRDQIRASESLEQDLRVRSTQLEHLLKEVQQLVGYVDVEPLVHDMTSNLGSLHGVMEDAQQCLQHRLKNLQVRCT